MTGETSQPSPDPHPQKEPGSPGLFDEGMQCKPRLSRFYITLTSPDLDLNVVQPKIV